MAGRARRPRPLNPGSREAPRSRTARPAHRSPGSPGGREGGPLPGLARGASAASAPSPGAAPALLPPFPPAPPRPGSYPPAPLELPRRERLPGRAAGPHLRAGAEAGAHARRAAMLLLLPLPPPLRPAVSLPEPRPARHPPRSDGRLELEAAGLRGWGGRRRDHS